MEAPLRESYIPNDSAARQQLETARAFSLLHGHAQNPFISHEPLVTYADGARVPFTVTTALDPNSTEWFLLSGGFCGVEEGYLDLANELALSGKTVVTFRAARHQGKSSLAPRNLLHPDNLLAEEIVAVADAVHNRYGVTELELDVHSMSGPAGVKGAERIGRREQGIRISKLVLLEAAGVTNHNIATLGLATPAILVEAVPLIARNPHIAKETIVHFGTNLARTSTEMLEVTHCRIGAERLDRIRDLGIATAAIYNRFDLFFPAYKAFAELEGAVDEFRVGSKGGHLAPMTYAHKFEGDLRRVDEALALKVLKNSLSEIPTQRTSSTTFSPSRH